MLRVTNLKVQRKGFSLSIDELNIQKGSTVILLGPNGAGKTTLLRCISGALGYSGSILFDEVNTAKLGHKEHSKLISFLSQRLSVTEMSVEDLILTGRFPYTDIFGRYHKTDMDVVASAARDICVSKYFRRTLDSLSQGELQRVLLTKIFAQGANVVLLDEPTTALDLCYKELVKEQLLQYRGKYTDSIMVISTHEPFLFMDMADHIIMLKEGSVFRKGDVNIYNEGVEKELFSIS